MLKNYLFFLLLVALISSNLFAEIINVPSDYQIIQDAINASKDGDTVLLGPGTYEQDFGFSGKKITIASQYLITKDKYFIDSTIIHGLISCGNNIDTSAKIIGLTLEGQNGIYCKDASPLISNNFFKSSIKCQGSSDPLIEKNSFIILTANYPYPYINILEGNPRIESNYFYGKLSIEGIRISSNANAIIMNNVIKGFLYGIRDASYNSMIINNLIYNCMTGVLCEYKANPLIVNNTIVSNSLYGIDVNYGVPEIINTIFWNNKKDFSSGSVSISHSCMFGCLPYGSIDEGGNIFRYPVFADTSNENFRLKGYSPCIDAGYSDSISNLLPVNDLDSNKRIQDGNGDNIPVIDIGCYERQMAVNPAYVSGKITLTGGDGKIEDVKVGIGTTFHPDSSGNYIFAISAPDSSYNISASLDNYLTKEIKNVEIKAGETTQNINFNLGYYNPVNILEIEPDTLKFITNYNNKLTMKNNSLEDIYIRYIKVYDYTFFYDEQSFSIPHYISPGDSSELNIYLNVTTGPQTIASIKNYLVLDSMRVFFNTDSITIPVIYDPSLVDVEEYGMNVNKYKLYQNYPNPFNPNTKIRYSIPKSSFVVLKIYNLLGEEVRTLVNERKAAGIYNVEFKANNLATGIYFYKIKADNFEQTKKLILLK